LNHVERLQALRACDNSIEFAAQFSHAQEAWENNTRPDWALWLLARLGGEHKRMAVRLAADFAEHVIHLTGEGRPAAEAAIAATRTWADDPCEETRLAALRAARAAAADAARAADVAYTSVNAAYAAYAAVWAAADAAEAAYANTAWAAANIASAASRAAADAADAAASADSEAEEAWQISRIREICPNCPIGEG
jgi:hypothetical protein